MGKKEITMKRITLSGLLLAVTCLLLPIAASAGEKATVVRLMGKAEILKAGDWQPAHAGYQLEQGDSIRVVGPGEVTLRSEDGKVLVTGKDNTTIAYNGEVDVQANPWKTARLAESGQVATAAGAKTVRQFYSPQGEVSVQVTPGETLHLVTPLITASVRGTTFSTKVGGDSTSSVNVCGGSVMSYGRTGNVQPVCPGQQSVVTPREYTRHLSMLGYCLPEGADWREYDQTILEDIDRRVLGSWFPK